MKLDDGMDSVPTYAGSISTLLYMVLFISYAALKCEVLYSRNDTDIMTTVLEEHYDASYEFDAEQGLNIAVAFTGWSDSEKSDGPIEESYGKLEFMALEWGIDADGKAWKRRTVVPSHECTDEELGLQGSSPSSASNFFRITKSSLKTVTTFKHKMRCIKQKEMRIRGSYDSEEGRLINVQLQKCVVGDGSPNNCKSESDIEEYFKDKFFLMLSNQVRFVQDDFSEKKVVRESTIKKLKISTQMR